MAYSAIDIVAGETIEESWGDKIESHLERLGAYRGMVESAANLPDVSTLDEGDWYILKTEQQIRMCINGAYVTLKFPPAPHANESHSTQMATSAELSSHSGNTSNPHSTTKSQVGLGSVENYGIASQAEAEAGTATNKYLTPLRVKQAILALQSVKSVAGKTGYVTLVKADVGLSNVENYGIASQAEAEAGTVTNKYITPERAKQAVIALQSVKSVAGKTGDVTLSKADIGLSNVENYGVASEIDAQNASSNEKYMTPLRVKNLLDADPRLTVEKTRTITLSVSDPYGGSDGDIWIKYGV